MRTIWVFRNHLFASYAVSLLESAGFDPVLLDESAFLNACGPMRLQVPIAQVAEATEMLKSVADAGTGEFDGPPDDAAAVA